MEKDRADPELYSDVPNKSLKASGSSKYTHNFKLMGPRLSGRLGVYPMYIFIVKEQKKSSKNEKKKMVFTVILYISFWSAEALVGASE